MLLSSCAGTLAPAAPVEVAAASVASTASAERPPNIIVLFADDMGYGDVGCFGSQANQTPNLDRLASEGTRFTSFYSASPGCSPSRAALLTGCYPQRVSLPGVLSPRSKTGLSPDEQTLAEVLKARGYATAAIGKWHLGDAPNLLPWNHGFDEYLGLPYSNDMWTYNWGTHDVGLIGTDRWGPIPLWSYADGEAQVVMEDPRQDSLTPRYTTRALDFIDTHQAEPFFLYLAWSHPHTPIDASPAFKGKTGAGLYADMLLELDDSAGRIVAKLEELGLDTNTLVFFTSDNGPWTRFGNHGGSSGPWRGDKGTTFEGGMRMPAIAWGPGRVAAGRVEERLATTMDLLPTLARFAGAEPGDGAWPTERIDGRDIRVLLEGGIDPALEERVFFYYWPGQLQAVRVGPWKLHFRHDYRVVEEAGQDGQPGRQGRAILEQSLFDLAADPGETTDVSQQHPAVVARLTVLAALAREQLGDRLTKTTGLGVRPGGVASWPAEPGD